MNLKNKLPNKELDFKIYFKGINMWGILPN